MKIALISDIHFGKFSRTQELNVPGFPIDDENEGAESLVEGYIKLLKDENADYLLIAGDMTSIASPLEFYYFEKAILHIADEAHIPLENIISVTGNHDNDWNIAKLSDTSNTENIKEYADILKKKYLKIAANSANINLNTLQGAQNGVAPFSGVIEKEEMIVFTINTGWQCSPSQVYSHGKLTIEQLKWLEDALKKYYGDSRTKVFLLHHHPIKYSYPVPSEDISMVEESSELLDLAGKYGVNLILHGHRHHPRAETIQKTGWIRPISFVCAGSLSVNSKHRSGGDIPNTAHFIDFQKAPDTFILRTYEYKPASGWRLLTHYRPEAPLDPEVWLGRLYQESDYITAIDTCLEAISNAVTQFKYEALPECLHYLSYKSLNQKFRDRIQPDYTITGSFPNVVSIIAKEVISNAVI